MKNLLLGAFMCLTACASTPGPSIPMKPGHSMSFARRAVQSCTAQAQGGGIAAVTGGYVTGIILGGLILGPTIVGLNQDNIRETGETDAVDRCLEEHGFERRNLSDGELFWLDESVGEERERRMDHLVGGGSMNTYGRPKLQ